MDHDLGSNFQPDFWRSDSSFDVSRQKEDDAGKMTGMSLLSQTLLPKNVFRKYGYFFSLWRLNRLS